MDEKVLKVAKAGPRKKLTWVKPHSSTEGNKLTNKRAKDAVVREEWMSEPSLVTSAGIRQPNPLFERLSHLKWNWDEPRGLTYLHTDRGPMKA